MARPIQNSPFSPPERRTDGSFRLNDPFWDPTARHSYDASSGRYPERVINGFLTGLAVGLGAAVLGRRR